MLDEHLINDEDFFSEVAYLFIHPKWFEAVKEACQRIDTSFELHSLHSNFDFLPTALSAFSIIYSVPSL